MSPYTPRAGSPPSRIVIAASIVTILALILGRPGVAEEVAGAVVIYVAFVLARTLIRMVAAETDPGRELVEDVFLTLVVVLALIGVGLMAAPLL